MEGPTIAQAGVYTWAGQKPLLWITTLKGTEKKKGARKVRNTWEVSSEVQLTRSWLTTARTYPLPPGHECGRSESEMSVQKTGPVNRKTGPADVKKNPRAKPGPCLVAGPIYRR